jgi:hypothetical protein
MANSENPIHRLTFDPSQKIKRGWDYGFSVSFLVAQWRKGTGTAKRRIERDCDFLF